MRAFTTALTFLSILRVSRRDYDYKNAPFYFPIVGLLIASPAYLMLTMSIPFKEFFTLLYLVIITGGLHLDGLADTADALFSHKSKEKKLEIMKDSRIGTFGVLGLLFLLLFRYELLREIRPEAIFLTLSYARLGVLIIFKLLPYARKEGTGKIFSDFEIFNFRAFFLLLPILLSFFILQHYSFYFNLFFLLSTFLILLWFRKIIGGWTGDMAGAYIEFMDLTLMFLLYLLMMK